MHNKFAVIDHQIVWTGSYNLTYTAPFNTNNVVVIKDEAVAAAYTHEFEEMGGGVRVGVREIRRKEEAGWQSLNLASV